MKDDNDALKLVIVRDMWLTGFDAHHGRCLKRCITPQKPKPRL
jgi:hypothetical protein